jgi:type IV secretory pathway TrbF-like protein
MATAPKYPVYQDLFVSHQAELMRRLLWGSLVVTALALALAAYLAFNRQVRTYVVETDSKGNPVGLVQPVLSTKDLSDKVMQAFVRQFVEDALTVTTDWNYDAIILDRSMNRAQGEAHGWLRDFYLGEGGIHDPRKLYLKQSQQAKVTNVLKGQADGWYEVSFTVYAQQNNGNNETTTADWKATLKAELGQTTNDNPLGIYITSMDLEAVQK